MPSDLKASQPLCVVRQAAAGQATMAPQVACSSRLDTEDGRTSAIVFACAFCCASRSVRERGKGRERECAAFVRALACSLPKGNERNDDDLEALSQSASKSTS